MKLKITNRKGVSYIIIYDKCDKELIKSYRWYVGTDGYVRTVEKYPKLLHRLILGLTNYKIHVDHKDHNKLNNSRSNIRICSRSQNMANRKPSGEIDYLGVSRQSYIKKGNRYIYIIARIKGKTLGRYKTEEDAARAYDAAAKVHHGEFANLNFKN